MRIMILAFLVFSACDTPVPPTDIAASSCNADGYQNLIGKSADLFASMTFPAPMRIIKPGMAVTMDYNPDRLNFDLDKNNRITRVWCG